MCTRAPVTASLLPVSGVTRAEHTNAAMAPELSLLGGGGKNSGCRVGVGAGGRYPSLGARRGGDGLGGFGVFRRV